MNLSQIVNKTIRKHKIVYFALAGLGTFFLNDISIRQNILANQKPPARIEKKIEHFFENLNLTGEAQAKELQIPTINDPGTISMVFPFIPPSNPLEKYILENTGTVNYMHFIRLKEDTKLATSLAKLVNGSLNINDWFSAYGNLKKSMELSKYVPLKDMRRYQQNQLHSQETIVPKAKVLYYQMSATGNLIPIKDISITKQIFEKLRNKFTSNGKKTEWSMHKGPLNSGYISTQVKLPLEKDWEKVIDNAILSPPAISGDRIFIGDYDQKLLALSARNGSIKWSTRITYSRRDTPTISNGKIYVTGIKIPTGIRYGARKKILRIETKNGKVTRDWWVDNPRVPIINEDSLYFVWGTNKIASIDFKSDSQWSYVANGMMSAFPIVEDDTIYFTSKHLRGIEVHALDKKGKLKWKSDATPNLGKNDIIHTDILKSDELVSAGNFLVWLNRIQRLGFNGPYQSCVEAFDITSRKISLHTCFGDSSFISSIVSDGHDVYVSSGKHIIKLIVEGNKIKPSNLFDLNSEISDLLLTDNILFAATKNNVLAIDRNNPNSRHKISDIEAVKYLAFSDGSLYVVAQPDNDGHIYRFSPTISRPLEASSTKQQELDLSTLESSIKSFINSIRNCNVENYYTIQIDYYFKSKKIINNLIKNKKEEFEKNLCRYTDKHSYEITYKEKLGSNEIKTRVTVSNGEGDQGTETLYLYKVRNKWLISYERQRK